ncbi:MAG TPA: hypothetical protein VFV77_01695 [Gammaproteobacteria bacterium]|nr:hypothetical protein [Gammaproteobacteria bacterium]
MHAIAQRSVGSRPEPYGQVELLLLFHPRLQVAGLRKVPAETCAAAAQAWLTLDVYGKPALSELTGKPVLEDLRLESGGTDIEALLPDTIVNEVADYLLGDA